MVALFFATNLLAQVPTITSFNPTSGLVGSLVTITGTNLNTPTGLTIGGVNAIAVSNTGTSLVAMVMPGASTGNIVITNTGGSASSSSNFTITPSLDPNITQYIQQGTSLVGSLSTAVARQGAVSISADGNTAIVGGSADNTNQGAAWIFTRSGSTWTQQGSKLLGTGNIGAAQQGSSVDISADGNTAIVGAPIDSSNRGAAWVFTRSGGVWSQQRKLVGTGNVGNAQQGISVSISADGNTAIVGGRSDNSNQGAVWIFTRSGGNWTQQGNKLVGTGNIGPAQQGGSVKISADGNTAIVGGRSDNSNQGAVWIFTRSGNVWSQQGSKLVGTTTATTSQQGTSVSISADGNNAIVGGPQDNATQGTVWVFTRSGGIWSQQGKLAGTDNIGPAQQGISVGISADGNTAIVGGSKDNSNVGAVWIYKRSGSTWTQQGRKLVGTDNTGAAEQGEYVSISADGNTSIVGGRNENGGQGAAWVFENTPILPPTIKSFTPSVGTIGSLVTIRGTNLSSTSALTIGGISSIIVSKDDSTLVAMAMPGTSTGVISVTNTVGAANTTSSFSYTPSLIPNRQQGNIIIGATGQSLGSSLSISADGNTAIVGMPNDSSSSGAARIYIRSGGVWSQQGNKLVGTGNVGAAQQGRSVSISADGNTAIIGGSADNSQQGAAWIFTRSGSTWTQLGGKLVGTTVSFFPQQGGSVSISADGNTAIVGGIADGSGQGAVWIFARSGGLFTQQGNKLVGTGSVGTANQGRSVSISADGNTAIVGGSLDNSNQGAAWIYTRSNGVWTQQGNKLVGTGSVGAANQGRSVSISADGNTAIVGGSADNTNQGAAWIYTRSNGVWTQQGNKLVGTGNIGAAGQGVSVSINADGNTAIVGGSGDNFTLGAAAGAAWIFTRSNGVWTQQGNKLVDTGSVAALQGNSVSISADGNTAIVGGPAHDSRGAFWTYVNGNPIITDFSPLNGLVGSLVTIRGLNLSPLTALTIGGVSAIIISNNGNTIVAMVMPGAVTGAITITTSFATVNSSINFTVSPSQLPTAQQGNKLVGTGNIGSAQQGFSVSISADGNTAIVGGSADNSNIGAAWIFTRSEGVWTQQGNKLVGTGNVGAAQQGRSVSISADGNTAIVGGSADNTNQGAAWIFTRSGSTWTQQGSKLVGTGNTGAAQQGISVSISADGNTAIVGGRGDNTNQGAAWIYRRSGSTWTQQGSKLVGTGNTGAAQQGVSVSISADGNTAIVGGSADNTNQGAAWIFTRSGSTWTQQGSKLVGTGNSGPAQQGVSVSISADGNTAIVGGSSDNTNQGAAWIFTRSGGVWTQQGNKLGGAGNTGPAQQGTSVSLSADGNTALIGGIGDNTNQGAAWLFTRSGGIWSQQGSKLLGIGNVGAARQGQSLSISADGNNAVIGGFGDNGNAGAAWSFTRAQLPKINSFTPNSGPVGTIVRISGTDLYNLTTFTIGGVSAIPISNNGNTLVAMVMPGSTSGPISITTNGGTSSTASSFTITSSKVPNNQNQIGNKLVGTSNVGAAQQGQSVSISADGNTAIIGGWTDSTNQGAAWIFTHIGDLWIQQGNKLVGTGNVGAARQGTSVGISADGNTAIIGGSADNTNQGAAWIFTRSNGVWSQQGNKLVGTGNIGAAQQGQSVSISADGNTAIIGGSADNSQQGAAWIFTRIGGVWNQQGNKLVGAGNIGAARQGISVGISADGNTAIVGGNGDNTNQGATWVYTQSGGVWNQQGNKLVGIGNVGAAQQGVAVSISADGNTAIVGGSADSTDQGAAWIFTRSGGIWTQQGNKLVGTGNLGAAQQGTSVSISADGNTAIVGGSAHNVNRGAAWLFTRSGSVWSQPVSSRLVGNGFVGAAQQGRSVSISADGSTTILGGNADNTNQGAAWVFSFVEIPSISSFSPTFGTVGSLITITGTNLDYLTSITIGNVSVLPVSNDGNNLVVMVMPGTISGTVRVNTVGGSANSLSLFTVLTSVHPSLQQGNKLVGTGNIGAAKQGTAVSISADGNTAIVGGSTDNSIQGAAWIFTRSGSTWTQQGNKLVGTGNVGGAQQGVSVSISADGNTAIVGGSADNTNQGAAWIFTRSGSTWTQQGSKLVGTGNIGAAQQGVSVSLSADGNTAIVGGSADNTNLGAAWIFTRSGGVWTQQGNKLVGTGNVGAAQRGVSVSISADGNTAIVGGSADNTNQGAAWIFTRSGSTWTQQGSKLVGTGNIGAAQQGVSVSLSADGNTALVGGSADNTNQGAAWIFTRSGSTWTQQGSKLSTGLVENFGSSLSISADGNYAVIGSPSSGGNTGVFRVYTRKYSFWTLLNVYAGTKYTGAANQGESVSISADGKTAIIGGNTDNSDRGASWIFVAPIVNTPTISSFSPNFGSIGTLITISGDNLDNLSNLTIGGVAAIPINNTPNTIVAMVMPGSSTGSIAVSTAGGSAISSGNFTIVSSLPPTAQEGNKLAGTGNVGAARQGCIVSVSADGNTAIVGGFSDNSNIGAAWIYTRSGGIWTQQGSKLVGTGVTGTIAQQGISVSISADGNTAIVGGRSDNFNQGAAWIFTRSGSTWKQQGSKLVGIDNTGAAQQGTSVCISADGNTAIVGGPGDNSQLGAAWIFVRIDTTWRQLGSKLVGTNSSGSVSNQGRYVSISADGNTAVVGGDVGNASWIFRNINGSYIQQGLKLSGGTSGSVSADGNTVILGQNTDNSNLGAAFIYIRLISGTYVVQGTKLVGTGSIGAAKQGSSVSISADGNTAIVGGEDDSTSRGAIWVYTRSGNVWNQQGNKLSGTGSIGAAKQGSSVSISADGNTAVVGGNADNSNQGAAWVFKVTPSNNADLSALLLSSGTLSPAFASSTSTYTASTSATSITVTPSKVDTNATIQVRVNSGSYAWVNSGDASAALPLNLGINTIDVNVIAQNFSTTKTYTITVTRVPLVNTWTGTASNVWNLATNWDPPQIPTNADDVVIAASSNNPVLSLLSAVKNITIDSGATLTVSGTLEIRGNLNTLGIIDATNGNIILNGIASQTLNAKGGTVQNLTINNAAGATLTGALNLTGILTPTSGVLTTGGNLTLKSTALTTASIASNLSGSNYISGNVTVERFIPGGKRAFRFFSHPFSSPVALSNMMGSTGLIITGSGGATNGFDSTQNNNPSAFTFSESAYDGTNNSGWNGFTNTSNTIAVGAGIRALHRGARSQLPAIVQANPPSPQAATIVWAGPINAGNTTFNMLKTAGANGGWNLIGNPYASAVNIGVIASGNRNSIGSFYVWNPNLATAGAYETQSFGADYILPSGSAFFINTPNAATFTFTEANKSTLTPAILFKNDTFKQHALEIQLWSDSSIHWDNFVLRNRSNLSDTFEYSSDGLKMKNSNVNFYTISSDEKNLAIDNRPLDESKEVKLVFETSSPYHFTFKVAHIQMPSLEVYLEDKFANKEVLLTATTAYDFVTTADTASQGAERFKLKFKNKPTTLVSESSIEKNAFSLFPNPATSTIYLSLANPAGTCTYALYNQLGVLLQTDELNFDKQRSHAIQIEKLPSGIYFVRLDGGKAIRFAK